MYICITITKRLFPCGYAIYTYLARWVEGFVSGILLVGSAGNPILRAVPTKKVPHWNPSAHMRGTCTFCAHHRSDYPPPRGGHRDPRLGSTAGHLPRPATAHPGPSLLTTHPGGALAGLGTHGSAGGGRWQRHLVAGVVGGGGVRGRHGHHHGHPHRR